MVAPGVSLGYQVAPLYSSCLFVYLVLSLVKDMLLYL